MQPAASSRWSSSPSTTQRHRSAPGTRPSSPTWTAVCTPVGTGEAIADLMGRVTTKVLALLQEQQDKAQGGAMLTGGTCILPWATRCFLTQSTRPSCRDRNHDGWAPSRCSRHESRAWRPTLTASTSQAPSDVARLPRIKLRTSAPVPARVRRLAPALSRGPREDPAAPAVQELLKFRMRYGPLTRACWCASAAGAGRDASGDSWD